MFTTKLPTCSIWLLASALALTTTSPSRAGDGDLDPTLDGDGMVSVHISAPFNDETEDVLVLPDRSIVLAGSKQYSSTDYDFAVIKLLPEGLLDSSFGNGGSKTVAFDLGGGGGDYGMAIAHQADGKLVIAGMVDTAQAHDSDLAVARLHANGAIDTSFGSNGKVVIPINLGGYNTDIATDVLIQSDGKIVVTGFSQGANFDSDFVAVRLNVDGSTDLSFGNQGRQIVGFDYGGYSRDESMAAALQSDGKIVLVGSVEWNNYDYDFAAVRLLSDGTPDGSFANGGKTTVAFDRGGADQDYADAVMIDGSGRIVLAGRSSGATYAEYDFAVARLLTDGTLDSSFSSDGKVTVGIDVGLGLDQASAVAAAPMNQIIVAGTAFLSTTNGDFAAVRLNDDGSLDTQFGIQGRARVDLDVGGNYGDDLRAIAVGPAGGIVMAGPADTNWGMRLTGVARLQGASWFSFP